MSRARPDDFDLAAAIARAEFTPRGGDAPALVALFARPDVPRPVLVRALARVPEAAGPAIAAAVPSLPEGEAAEAVRALAELPSALALPHALARCDDPRPRVRRAAYGVLGRHPSEAGTTLMLDALGVEALPELRVLCEALAASADPRVEPALARLAGRDVGRDPELARRLERALLVLRRDLTRTHASVRLDVALPPGTPIECTCRRGLEGFVVGALGRVRGVTGARIEGPGLVSARASTSLGALHEVRTFLELSLPLGEVALSREDDLPVALADHLARPSVRGLLAALTEGLPRIRLALGAGRRRALVWAIAAELERRGVACDPREATFELRVEPSRLGAQLRLVPKSFDDPRHTHRLGDVPAASHPTLAAALAELAALTPDDHVWEPFVGSGQELVECARYGVRSLEGSDLSAEALRVARANLDAVGVSARLVEADATTHRPAVRPTVVLTNPPMGRRVHRGDVSALLTAFLTHVAEVLAPGGRLVWITPLPRVTTPVLEGLGLRLERSMAVDLGGFDGRLESIRKPNAAR